MKNNKGFTKRFGDSGNYVCEGDSITCTVNGFDISARIVRDDCGDRPDERQDGFWPSLDPKDAGYIGPKSASALARHKANAERVMREWENDEWFYCGVVVTVSRCDVELSKESLWGIECNYPINRKRANVYLLTVANELLDEAIASAELKLEEILQSRSAA